MRIGAIMVLAALAGGEAAAGQETWFRGNLHVHTDRSDGGSPPAEVVAWYRERGYDFLALTDHNLQVVTPALTETAASGSGFLLLTGVEVTDRIGSRPVHLNGLGVRGVVEPQGGATVSVVIDRNVQAIERAGGIAVLNHPNGLLRSAITAAEISATSVELFEVCCSDYLGGSGYPSTDEIWDAVLSTGHRLFGLASDDAHDFSPYARDPGSSWVMVAADELSASAILRALREGSFYSTTGVTLEAVERASEQLCVRIADYADYGFRTEYIGTQGRLLSTSEDEQSCQAMPPDGGYVRARVVRSDGARAWVQPIFSSAGL